MNDFKPFGPVMTKIRNRKIDPSYEVYLGLYQALTGPDEEDKIFKSVSRDFFDLIVIDECHRGSANDDSAWKEILEYFDGSIQLGLTATPKETKYASNITYFGESIYTYTLITTNYDRLLEQVFDNGGAGVQVINGETAMEPPDPQKVTLIKIHGDVKDPAHCILGKVQYDAAYGEADLDLHRPVPKILGRYYSNNNLLFIGCSLKEDRTVQVFQSTKDAAGDFSFPQHFAIEQAPEQLDALVARNSELSRWGSC